MREYFCLSWECIAVVIVDVVCWWDGKLPRSTAEAVKNCELLLLFVWRRNLPEHPSESFAEFSRLRYIATLSEAAHPRERFEGRKKILLPILFVLSLWVFMNNLYVVSAVWILWASVNKRKWILNLSFVRRFVDEGSKSLHILLRQGRRHNGEFTLNP